MPILTTNAGRNAAANAEAGGFLVDLMYFAVTQKTGVQLSVLDTALAGPAVYKAEIQSIEPVSEATVRCTCYIPVGYPTTQAPWTLTELGLYLRDDTLFAHATLATPFVKSSDFGLKFYVFVTLNRLGEIINVTLGQFTSLASSASVRNLIAPQRRHRSR